MNAQPATRTPTPPLSAASRSMIDRLIAFNTVSRDSNLGLIEWVRDYLQGQGATTRLTHDASGKKANLFATLGDSPKPGLILSGHTDVVPVDGQDWATDPFTAIERDGKLYARGSADMKGFIGIILAQAPRFVAALNGNRLEAPLHYALSYDEEVGCLGGRAQLDSRSRGTGHPACRLRRRRTDLHAAHHRAQGDPSISLRRARSGGALELCDSRGQRH
jgi:acetylornithine deacetylase